MSGNFRNTKDSQPTGSPQDVEQVTLMWPTVDRPDRGLAKDVLAYFGVRHRVTDGVVTHEAYPVVDTRGAVRGYKVRSVADKAFTAIGDTTKAPLWGGLQARGSQCARLIICEGEIDAMSVWQAIWQYQVGGEYEGRVPAVVSVPYGAGGGITLTDVDRQLIADAKEVCLLFDNDEPGREGLESVTKLLPRDKVVVASISGYKDANEMLVAGKYRELAELALFRGQRYQPPTIVRVGDIVESILTPPEVGWDWPWDSLTLKTYGIRPGNLYGIGGGVGSSKTTLCCNVAATLLEQGVKVGFMAFENTPDEVAQMVAGILDGVSYDRPDSDGDKDKLAETVRGLDDRLFLSKAGGIDTVDDALELASVMAVVLEAQVVIIDPVSHLVAGLSASEGNEHLNRLMKESEKLAKQLGIAIILTSHLNPRTKGLPHEEGGEVSLVDFTGSRALMRKAAVCIGVERNSRASGKLSLYNRLVVLKHRGCNPARPNTLFTEYRVNGGRMVESEGPPGGSLVESDEPPVPGIQGNPTDDVPW